MHFIPVKKLVASLVLLGFASAAWAQYVWTDERGVKQFSDQPPPASVPKSRVLKHPGSAAGTSGPANTAAPAGTAAPAAGSDAAAKAPLTTAERNADYMKRRAEQAEKDKKAATEAQAASDKSKNCENARQYQTTLASGQRMASTNSKGEREYLSDDQREREMKETGRILADCK
ncbi:DUF4124 domain-containing protein [Janthinobacterium sp. 17J80-10]|uniref:DUF4124 domain-containing protein n=1 Tax=Janthinobacterium sp. 17J80-10 TaxID=2497863 RepID=UPI0010055847|nr:DUF4124 domain-containing protein [Janthinobacterium sp. 17J80-10]QAU34608.1 DUF4124 domain-containing protein [Janthinobacterium sp. 17J80-10]